MEERISELEDKSIEMIQMEAQRGKKEFLKNQEPWSYIKHSDLYNWRPRRWKENKPASKIFEGFSKIWKKKKRQLTTYPESWGNFQQDKYQNRGNTPTHMPYIKKKIFKIARGKKKKHYIQRNKQKITADFSSEIMEARKPQSDIK